MLMGTVGYMSPEQIRGETARAPSDIFAFGCVLYEMLTGRRAFTRQTAAEMMAAILRDEPPPLAAGNQEVALELERVIRHCLEKQPEERFQSASDLAFDLRKILSGSELARLSPTFSVDRRERTVVEEGKNEAVREDTLAPSTMRQVKRGLRSKRNLLVTAGIAFALLALALSYLWRARQRQPASQPLGTPSIAVLPFQDMSPSKDKEYLCDGLTEELIASLTGLADLRVASRTSVSQYRGRAIDLRRIGEELKVQAVLEGSLRIEGSRIRVIVQLVNTRDGFHLWTHTYDGDIAEISDIQHQVADAIFRRFRIDLPTTRRPLVQPPSRNVEAWHHYIRAAYLSRSQTPQIGSNCIGSLLPPIPITRSAWAGVSLAWVKAVQWEESPYRHISEGTGRGPREVAIDATLAEAHQAVARGEFYYEREWEPGGRSAHAVELDPTYLEARLDYAQLVLIPTRSVSKQTMQELEQGPLHCIQIVIFFLNELANAYIKARQYDKAVEGLEASQKIHQRQLGTLGPSGDGGNQAYVTTSKPLSDSKRPPPSAGQAGCSVISAPRMPNWAAEGTLFRVGTGWGKIMREGPPPTTSSRHDLCAALGDKDGAWASFDRARRARQRNSGLTWITGSKSACGQTPRFGRLVREFHLD